MIRIPAHFPVSSEEPAQLACLRFRWRALQRVRMKFPGVGPNSKKLSNRALDSSLQEAVHEQLARANRRTFRGQIALEVTTFGTGRDGKFPQLHATAKWLLDLLGSRRTTFAGTRRKYLLYKDDRQVKYLSFVCFSGRSRDAAIYATARPMRYFLRDLSTADRAMRSLDTAYFCEPQFSADAVERYDLFRDEREDLEGFLGRDLSGLEGHYKAAAQGYFAEAARVGLVRLQNLNELIQLRRFLADGNSEVLSPKHREGLRALEEIRTEIASLGLDFLSGRFSLRLSLQGDQRARFADGVSSLFRSYRKRLGDLGVPLFLPPGIQIVYLEADEDAYDRRDVDNVLRRVLGVFQQEIRVSQDSWGMGGGRSGPMFCEIISLPGWSNTGLESVLSIGIVPGPPFHVSLAQEMDKVVEAWCDDLDDLW